MRLRKNEEESYIVTAVCDGMGGMQDGEICASLALAAFFSSFITSIDADPREILIHAAHEANHAVNKAYSGKGGTTLSVVSVSKNGCINGINIGDSRIYFSSETDFRQLTKDDTIAGQFSNHDEPSHLSRELLQYIGIGTPLEPNIVESSALDRSGKFIITTDGTHSVGFENLRKIIDNSPDPLTTSRRLLELARWHGGRDNASIAVTSRIDDLIQKSSMAPCGLVELWDPYGDLQIVLLHTNSQPTTMANDSGETHNSRSKNKKDGTTIKKIAYRTTKKYNAKRKTKSDLATDQTEQSISKPAHSPKSTEPQLKIDFE